MVSKFKISSLINFFLINGFISFLPLAHAVGSENNTWNSLSQAWIYPGSPTCDAPQIYSTQKIHTLKPQYFNVISTGQLEKLTVKNTGCNAFSKANIASIKANSEQQFVTISATYDSMVALISNSQNTANAITTLVNFVTKEDLTGIELDFEGFINWSQTDYQNYKNFVTALGTNLHTHKKQLMLDCPATTQDNEQWFVWRHADFEPLPVDYLVLMVYDYQYDFATGAPVSPTSWLLHAASWAKANISDINRLVIGIPAYGYHRVLGEYALKIDTYSMSRTYLGFNTAIRDPDSFELTWIVDNTFYSYIDSQSLNSKRTVVEEQTQIPNISVWHLGGGNQWFRGKDEPSKNPLQSE